MNGGIEHLSDTTQGEFSRRALLRGGGWLFGGAFVCRALRARQALAVSTAAQAATQTDPIETMREFMGKAPINVVPMAGSLHMLSGPGGNIGVSVGEDGIILVDSGVAPASERVKAAVATLSPQPIRILLNTHWHFDHTDGNEVFGKSGAMIVAHENVRKRLGSDQVIEFFHHKFPASPKQALPRQTFQDSLTLHFNEEEIHIFHVPPAHTDGDSVIQFRRANVVHAGDLLFNGMYPFIDASTGGSIDGMIAAADRLLALVDAHTKLIPGHGPVTDRGGVEEFRGMLIVARDRIKPMIAAGKTLDEIIAAKPTKDLDDKWGKGFFTPDQFVAIVHSTLTH